MSRAVLVGVVVSALACGGLEFSSPSFEAASARQVQAAGYDVPPEAVDIYVYDFSQVDIRSTWFRFQLPAPAFEDLRAEYEASADHERLDGWQVPSSWPDFGQFDGGAAPAWWAPETDRAFRKTAAADGPGGGEDMTRVSQTGFDTETRTVWVWMWEWQWWAL